jgi:predicted NAD/FAD-binding protein
MSGKKHKIAIIGAGVAGNVAAYYLNKENDIKIFESNNYIGGHVNTIDVSDEDGDLAIDTGFIVFNDKTYPNFISLMNDIDQPHQDSVMSFSVTNKLKKIEYNGSSLNGLFTQRSNIFSFSFLKMIKDILRFNKNKHNQTQLNQSLSVGDFLKENVYSVQFSENYLLPMAASIWSAEQKEILDMPINFLLNFFNNHGLLQIKNRPQWMVIPGGSREYIKKLSSGYKDKIILNAKIDSVTRHKDFVTVKEKNKASEDFDYVFIATHSDQALSMINDPSDCEHDVLSAIKYQNNEAILHTDVSQMPSNKRAWAAWNYRINDTDNKRVNVTYSMNILQNLNSKTQYFVTLNNNENIEPKSIISKFNYSHPIFNNETIKAQARHKEINFSPRTFYCGAYWRNGFHEDGVVSAKNALTHFKEQLLQ